MTELEHRNLVPVTISVDGHNAIRGSLEMHTDMIDVSVLGATKPNLAWEYVDPAGHFHAYDKDGKLPTVDSGAVHMGCTLDHSKDEEGDEECEGWNRPVYACSICAYEIHPERLADHERKFIPGMSSWSVIVEGLDYLETRYGTKVSVVMTVGESTKWFGVAQVTTTGGMGDMSGDWIAMATLTGAGPLGRKR